MKLSNLSVIFIIIIIPIMLVVSYYISLQIDTINMQTSYNTKQLDATKEAIEAFEINTVEWNEAYSEVADSKRRDVMASINTFITSFSNSLGVGGTSKENILTYIPAIACTLYDGYYIYSPTDTKEVIKDENGVAVFITEELVNNDKGGIITGYTYNRDDNGKLLYEASTNAQGTYTTYDGTSKSFTLNPDNAKSTYSHILKPFASYSARYKKGNTDITVNYTLDNYITIYGTVQGEYVIKSGYLIDTDRITKPNAETLKETIAYYYDDESRYSKGEYTYIYIVDKDTENAKVYFDGDTIFQVDSNGKRTNLDVSAKYKKIVLENGTTVYQALNNGTILADKKAVYGNYYSDMYGTEYTGDTTELDKIDKNEDVSARNYYFESRLFTNWVNNNLKNITIDNMQDVDDKSIYGNLSDSIFNINQDNDPESEDSAFIRHKREIIKQSLISSLNQAITSYSRNSEQEYKLPVLTETDWDQILRNVSIITFVQDIPIGMKYYNNYTVATSTSNKEYVNPDEIYLSNLNESDGYYHMPYCSRLKSNNIIGYRNTDYAIKSYNIKESDGSSTTNYYYRHSELANQACYYCLVQRELYNSEDLENIYRQEHKRAYETALARERYIKRTTRR